MQLIPDCRYQDMNAKLGLHRRNTVSHLMITSSILVELCDEDNLQAAWGFRHLTSYSMQLHAPVFVACHLVWLQDHFHNIDQQEGLALICWIYYHLILNYHHALIYCLAGCQPCTDGFITKVLVALEILSLASSSCSWVISAVFAARSSSFSSSTVSCANKPSHCFWDQNLLTLADYILSYLRSECTSITACSIDNFCNSALARPNSPQTSFNVLSRASNSFCNMSFAVRTSHSVLRSDYNSWSLAFEVITWDCSFTASFTLTYSDSALITPTSLTKNNLPLSLETITWLVIHLN